MKFYGDHTLHFFSFFWLDTNEMIHSHFQQIQIYRPAIYLTDRDRLVFKKEEEDGRTDGKKTNRKTQRKNDKKTTKTKKTDQ